MGTFNAQFAGTCDGCEERIVVGDRVRYVANNLFHAGCAEAARVRVQPVEVVCTECFILKPCPCQDGV